MKTWKSKRRVCRSRKSGKFSKKAKCCAFKWQHVRRGLKSLFQL